MQAEIVAIGDELLIGQTINTNSAWLGEKLNEVGIRVHRSTAISDDRSEIIKALDEAISRSQVVIMTGGLGPTKDDITKKTLCEYFNTGLAVNEEALERIKGFFARRGLEMLEVNLQQAELPESCLVIQNYLGTACGMWFEKEGAIIVSMPGVPYEMIGMMENEVIPRLIAHFDRPRIVHRTLLTTGIGESYLAEKIKDWENSLDDAQIKLAYLPSPGAVKLRLSSYGGDERSQLEVIRRRESEVMDIIGEHVFGYDKDSLAGVVGALLRESSATVSVAESCTGGFLSHLITSVSGCSDYFLGGAVTYTEAMKQSILGVKAETIAKYNVVSVEVAEEMARGARNVFHSDFAMSITGIAGPTGGTDEIPIGTICIAIATPKTTVSRTIKLGKRREFNIEMAANTALNMLRKEILNISR